MSRSVNQTANFAAVLVYSLNVTKSCPPAIRLSTMHHAGPKTQDHEGFTYAKIET